MGTAADSQADLSAGAFRLAIAAARYNEPVVTVLLAGARAAWEEAARKWPTAPSLKTNLARVLDMLDRPAESEKVLERFRRVNPIPEPWLQPEDVTRAVMYLVTDPGVITGFVMEVGLGSSARMH